MNQDLFYLNVTVWIQNHLVFVVSLVNDIGWVVHVLTTSNNLTYNISSCLTMHPKAKVKIQKIMDSIGYVDRFVIGSNRAIRVWRKCYSKRELLVLHTFFFTIMEIQYTQFRGKLRKKQGSDYNVWKLWKSIR